jgi:protein-disulfide isomerase
VLPGRGGEVGLENESIQERTPLKRILVIAVLLGSLALAQSKPAAGPAARKAEAKPAAAGLPTEATVDSFIRHYWGYNPQLQWKVDLIEASEVPGMAEVLVTFAGDPPQRMRMYVSTDGEHAIVGDALPFGADPFKDERALLAAKASGPAQGAEKPSVLIVEFSDLQCPHCKAAHPILERLMSEEPQARLVFQNFPLPSHDWAQKAAQYADCVGQKSSEQFWKFAGSIFEAQESINAANADEKLMQLATAAGADGAAMKACSALPATAQRVKQSFDLGRQLDVSGTPTVFVNGRRISSIGSLPYEELKAMVDFEAELAGKK